MAHRLAPEAEADVDELWYYVATNTSVDTADRFVESLTTRFFLLDAPSRWAPARGPSSRLAILRGRRVRDHLPNRW